MWKKILTMSLLLVVVLSFAACGKGAKLPSAYEIVSGVIDSLDDIRTSQFDVDVTMDIVSETEGEAVDVTMTIDSSGTLDFENKKMRMDMIENIALAEEPQEDAVIPFPRQIELYFISDMAYMRMELPEAEPIWMKTQMPVGYWEEVNQVEPQIKLLETAQVDVIASEEVRGVDCYVLELTPDLEQLWQIAMQHQELLGVETPLITGETLQEMFRSFSVKQWVAKDTYFLIKVEIDMAVESTPEAMGSLDEEGAFTMDITMDLLFYNYSQPVSIELPPEAEEATEMPME
jgi:hypothetical protein